MSMQFSKRGDQGFTSLLGEVFYMIEPEIAKSISRPDLLRASAKYGVGGYP